MVEEFDNSGYLRAAQEKLDAAVEEFIRDTGWNSSGVLTSWIIVGHQMNYDEDGDEIGAYPIVFKNGVQAHHINVGLLGVGLKILEGDRYQRMFETEE